MVSGVIRMKERVYQTFIFAVIALICLTAVFPLLYVISTSLVMEAEYVAKDGFVLWPSNPTLAAYERLLGMESIWNAFYISVGRTLVGTILMLSMTTITAYIVSRRNMPGARALMLMLLITILFNGGLIPTFLTLKELGFYDNFWVFIIPSIVDSWSVLVLRQFMSNLPRELEESAGLDGANEVQLFTYIILPMSLPSVAAIAMFIAVFHWNDWFTALIYIENDRLKPLQLLVRNMLVDNSGSLASIGTNMGVNLFDPTKRVGEQTHKLATVVFGTLPILCVYPFLQKYFVKGMYVGAIKE